MTADGRIPLEFLTTTTGLAPRPDTLLVTGADMPPPPGWAGLVVVPARAATAFGHGTGCQCCTGRGGTVAATLGDIFRQRATGGLEWFTRVAVLPPVGQARAWRAALEGDVLVSARFALPAA
ncbi:hypothetical protein [Komagataeibacter sp. FNDCR2]|uniref:hypothetical protein n=1 Tax=Komagataeibacter sp. FNDCR2 TaxID=2878682 RepID=UPI001E5FA26B|nr:hypothetical protein [Komagataeibacter sp. FNDCR2]MCE2575923.1 hypothetical protein [Komagataeibacter sp. FNDCR2]